MQTKMFRAVGCIVDISFKYNFKNLCHSLCKKITFLSVTVTIEITTHKSRSKSHCRIRYNTFTVHLVKETGKTCMIND